MSDDAAYLASRPYRFVSAVQLAIRQQQLGEFEVLHCPRSLMLPPPRADDPNIKHPFQAANRGADHTPDVVGTMCEPWIARGVVTILNQLFEPHHHGLEWSSGSSTLWALQRLASLISVEHTHLWLSAVHNHVRTMFDAETAAHWTGGLSPCIELQRGACRGWAHSKEGANNYTAYVALPRKRFLPAMRARHGSAFPGWDYVMVDGRSRANCMLEALSTPGFINRAGHGLLVLDNADRPTYHAAIEQVPRSWLKASFRYRWDKTIVWMACTVNESHCVRARHALKALPRAFPKASSWLKTDATHGIAVSRAPLGTPKEAFFDGLYGAPLMAMVLCSLACALCCAACRQIGRCGTQCWRVISAIKQDDDGSDEE